jgi:hypothetical protein
VLLALGALGEVLIITQLPLHGNGYAVALGTTVLLGYAALLLVGGMDLLWALGEMKRQRLGGVDVS